MLYAALKHKPGWSRAFTRPGGKSWDEMSEAEHQRFPDDYEAQIGQGEMTLHSEEHLATTDQGLAMLRRFILQQAEAVAEGKDPVGTAFDEDSARIETHAGNFLLDS